VRSNPPTQETIRTRSTAQLVLILAETNRRLTAVNSDLQYLIDSRTLTNFRAPEAHNTIGRTVVHDTTEVSNFSGPTSMIHSFNLAGMDPSHTTFPGPARNISGNVSNGKITIFIFGNQHSSAHPNITFPTIIELNISNVVQCVDISTYPTFVKIQCFHLYVNTPAGRQPIATSSLPRLINFRRYNLSAHVGPVSQHFGSLMIPAYHYFEQSSHIVSIPTPFESQHSFNFDSIL